MTISRQLETLATWKLCLMFGVVAILPFLGGIQAEFLFDDKNAILGNPIVTGDFDLLAVFSRDFWGRESIDTIGSYRPLTVLSFCLDQAIGGGSPWAFHLSNLLFHGIASAALFAYINQRFDRKLAAIATAIFALHALHTENVLAIVARADVLATIFVVATLWLARCGAQRSWLAGLTFFLALLCKEIAVAAFAVLLADLILGLDSKAEADRRSRLISLGSMIAAFVLYIALRHLALGLVEAPVRIQGNPLLDASSPERLYTCGALFARSLGLMLLPWTLIADYSAPAILPETNFFAFDVILGLLFSLILVAAMWTLRKRQPAIVWGLAILAASYFPVSNLLVLVPAIFAERLLYLPSIGFCVGLAQLYRLGSQKQRWRLPLALLFGSYLAFNMVRSSVRTNDWLSGRDLFAAAVESEPVSMLSHLQLGIAEREAGNLAAAAYQFDQAIQLAPNYGDPYTQLGVTLDLMNSPEQAHKLLTKATQVTSRCLDCGAQLVNFFVKYGRFEAAESEIRRLEQVLPDSTQTTALLRERLQRVKDANRTP